MIRFAGVFLTAVIGATFIGGFIGGCSAQGSSTAYMRGKAPASLAKVSTPGVYGLFAKDGTTPFFTDTLQKGDEYGFWKTESGEVVGYLKYQSGEMRKVSLQTWMADGYMWKFVSAAKKM